MIRSLVTHTQLPTVPQQPFLRLLIQEKDILILYGN